MAELLTFKPADVTPQRDAVLNRLGVPNGHTVSSRVEALLETTFDLFSEFVLPVGMFQEIGQGDFARVFEGRGHNEPNTPVGDVFPQADHLALFAVTIGSRIGSEITRLFEARDAATGCMLDSAVALGADRLAEVVERRYFDRLLEADKVDHEARALRYSPGYCGWNITGQVALFEALRPVAIGVTLGESHMMDPLKSVSGVLLAGSKRIHEFDDNYAFCSRCTTRGCRERIAALDVG